MRAIYLNLWRMNGYSVRFDWSKYYGAESAIAKDIYALGSNQRGGRNRLWRVHSDLANIIYPHGQEIVNTTLPGIRISKYRYM